MNRTERMYAIVEALRGAGARGRTAEWLAERFECSTRTVKRDIAALTNAEVPIVSQDGRGGGYQLAKQATLPPLSFSGSEAAALAIIIAATPHAPFIKDARAAMDKVLAAMSSTQRDEVEHIASRIWMRAPHEPIRSKASTLLDEALRRGVVARISYEDGQGRTSSREIEPMVFARTGGRWFALAWCRERQAGRWFRLDRIQRVHLTKIKAPTRQLDDVFGPHPADAAPVSIRSTRSRRRMATSAPKRGAPTRA